MRTDEELLQDVILYLNNLAEIRSSNEERGIIIGNRQVEEWNDIYDSAYKHHVSTQLSRLARQLETAYKQGEYEDNVINSTKVFMYVFDKCFDLAYITISPTGDRVFFKIEEIGNEYEHIAPSYWQKITKRIELIGNDLYQFMKGEGYMKLPFHKWMYFYMCAAETLALSFLLEQDLNN